MVYPILEELRINFPFANFFGFDPLVDKKEIESLGLNFQSSLEEAFDKKTVALILTNHSESENLPITDLLLKMNPPKTDS